MSVLYKYLSADGLEDLLEHGRIRVGTLCADGNNDGASSDGSDATERRTFYRFSASLRCDRELMERLEHVACVRIGEPARFFEELSARIKDAGHFLGFRQVVYEDPRHPKRKTSILPPAFLEGIEYAYQSEVRALWEPRSEPIEPLVVSCPEAARLCELCLSR